MLVRPTPKFRLLGCLTAAVALLVLSSAPVEARSANRLKKKQLKKLAELPEEYQRWVWEVKLLLSDEELELFMEIEQNYERDAFIDRFWKSRDTYQDTGSNEFKEEWDRKVSVSYELFGTLDDVRSDMLLLNDYPDARVEITCGSVVWPNEVWYYGEPNRMGYAFYLIFFKRYGVGNWMQWMPADGLETLSTQVERGPRGETDAFFQRLQGCLNGSALYSALAYAMSERSPAGGPMGYSLMVMRVSSPPEAPAGEWVTSFQAFSTEVEDGEPMFDAETFYSFPGRRQSRTSIQGSVRIPVDQLRPAEFAESTSYNLLLNGQVVRDDELFDRFRYRFDIPGHQVEGDTVPLVFNRFLRPGDYRFVLRVEDVNGPAFYRSEELLEVPLVENEPPPPADPETARLLAEANAAISTLEHTVSIMEPHGDIQVGRIRFDAQVTGPGVDSVIFALDRAQMLTKRKPPFSVELDLGKLPKSQTLTATALDATGQELARDELLINASAHRFAVSFLKPRSGRQFVDSVQTEVQIEVPEGRRVDRLELYLDEDLVATIYQPPWEHPIRLPNPGGLYYIRAKAYLPDDKTTDDTVFVNAPAGLDEELEIQMVELFTSVVDRSGRPVKGLAQDRFTVFEDGQQQELRRFDVVEDLPFSAAILLDVSGSMDESLPRAQQAALTFYENILTPKDRAALITFNDRPTLRSKFTNRLADLGGGLAGLKAERGTALYDSVIFSLYYFNGVKGQRALLILSDGKDESSQFTFEETLDFSRRAGVTIYAVGLKFGKKERDARKKLERLTDQTGGRSFFIETAEELPDVYAAIEDELRSQYFLAYQSTNASTDGRFRSVEVEVDESGLEAKTIRGYYP